MSHVDGPGSVVFSAFQGVSVFGVLSIQILWLVFHPDGAPTCAFCHVSAWYIFNTTLSHWGATGSAPDDLPEFVPT